MVHLSRHSDSRKCPNEWDSLIDSWLAVIAEINHLFGCFISSNPIHRKQHRPPRHRNAEISWILERKHIVSHSSWMLPTHPQTSPPSHPPPPLRPSGIPILELAGLARFGHDGAFIPGQALHQRHLGRGEGLRGDSKLMRNGMEWDRTMKQLLQAW